MKFKIISGLNSKNENIKLPQPIWFKFLVNNFGTNREFKFIFLEQIPNDMMKLQLQFENEDEPKWLVVDKITKNICNNFETFELVASSPLNLIWQNFVKPETFSPLTLNTLLEKFCKPFQIESVHPSLQNHTPSEFFTVLGMTCWDVVRLFFIKNFNSTIFVNKNKQITTKFKIPNPPQLKTNCPYMTSFKNLTDQTKLLSEIMVQLPDDESNQFFQLKPSPPLLPQLNLNRSKFVKLPKQFSLLQNKGAKTIIDQENANHRIVEIEFAKLLEPLWPGSLVNLTDNNKKIELCVSDFQLSLSKNGPLSKIKFFYSNLIN